MPSSRPDIILDVLAVIRDVNPRSALDVGIGFGKYGVLFREYLELWDGRNSYDFIRTLDGIEPHEPYITPMHQFIYDDIYVDEAVETMRLMASHGMRYDLVYCVDVLEHFTREEGKEFLALTQRLTSVSFIATPKDIGTQGPAFGNEYERHKTTWTREDFPPHATVIENERCLMVRF